jgi:hypothetical protein
MNVLTLLRFLFIVAFSAPIIRYCYNRYIEIGLKALRHRVRNIFSNSNKEKNQENEISATQQNE